MCMLVGGRVTLLTSVYFRCSNGGPLTDAAGPLMNLVVGMACWVLLQGGRPYSQSWHLFLTFAMAFTLFWGTGYFVFSGVTDTGDWSFVLRGLPLEPHWLWRTLISVLGAYLYCESVKRVAIYVPPGTPLVLPYLVGGAVSVSAVLFFAGSTLPALRAAMQESLGAAVGFLFLAYKDTRRGDLASAAARVAFSPRWLIISAIVMVAFFATLGRGFGGIAHAHA